MAIGTDSAIEFFGTEDTITSTGASTTNNSFTAAGTWTNDDDAPQAAAVFLGAWATAPTANTVVNLYVRVDNIDSTNDQDTPDANFQHTFVGSFPLNDVGGSTTQRSAIQISLPNTYTSQVYHFYIENKSGQTLNVNWTLKITPKTIGPHA